jgi:hypothetical protein
MEIMQNKKKNIKKISWSFMFCTVSVLVSCVQCYNLTVTFKFFWFLKIIMLEGQVYPLHSLVNVAVV